MAKGVKIFAYLNDWLIWESDPHRCRAAGKGSESDDKIRVSSQRKVVNVDFLAKSQLARSDLRYEQRIPDLVSGLQEQGEGAVKDFMAKKICHEKTARMHCTSY